MRFPCGRSFWCARHVGTDLSDIVPHFWHDLVDGNHLGACRANKHSISRYCYYYFIIVYYFSRSAIWQRNLPYCLTYSVNIEGDLARHGTEPVEPNLDLARYGTEPVEPNRYNQIVGATSNNKTLPPCRRRRCTFFINEPKFKFMSKLETIKQ